MDGRREPFLVALSSRFFYASPTRKGVREAGTGDGFPLSLQRAPQRPKIPDDQASSKPITSLLPLPNECGVPRTGGSVMPEWLPAPRRHRRGCPGRGSAPDCRRCQQWSPLGDPPPHSGRSRCHSFEWAVASS